MRIGEFSRRVGASTTTVRRAERRGLIDPPRDWTGARCYGDADIETLRRKLAAQRRARSTRGDQDVK